MTQDGSQEEKALRLQGPAPETAAWAEPLQKTRWKPEQKDGTGVFLRQSRSTRSVPELGSASFSHDAPEEGHDGDPGRPCVVPRGKTTLFVF